jgi:hypothetical protein
LVVSDEHLRSAIEDLVADFDAEMLEPSRAVRQMMREAREEAEAKPE